jgi:dihydroorotate dehydrogenase
MYKSLVRSILFQFDPEKVHHFTFSLIKGIMKIPFVPRITKLIFKVENPKLQKDLLGLKFENPVGLAAGFDKNALLFDEFVNYGFGFIEVGTVTPKPQPGNPKKRIFRLKADEALINRMGFNNDGVDVVVERLRKRKTNIIIGGNIGKNKVTPNERAIDDYMICFEKLF